MSDAKKPKADRTGPRLLLSLVGRLERYMARAGLVAFMADPVAAPTAAPAAAPVAAPTAAPTASPAPAPVAGGTNLLADPPAPPPATAPAAAPATEPTAEEKAAAEAKAAEEAKAKVGAPEKYEAFTLPEGAKVDEARMGKFTEWAKTTNLSQEQAQAAMDLAGDMLNGSAESFQTQLTEQLNAQAESWAQASKTDKEFGGDEFDKNMATARKAIDKFAPELKPLLVASKLGNHPDMLRAFWRIGQAISEDGFVPGRAGAGGEKSVAQRMYPNMNP